MPYCIHCGTQNPDVAKFCSNCGAAIVTAQVVPSPKEESKPQPKSETHDPVAVIHSPMQQPVQQQIQESNQQTIPLKPIAAAEPKTPITPSTSIDTNMNRAVRYVATWGALFVVVGFFFP